MRHRYPPDIYFDSDSACHSACYQNAYRDISLRKNFSYSIHIAIHLYLVGPYAVLGLYTNHCQGEAYIHLEGDIFPFLQRALNAAEL